jgi:hypothetical protein
VIATGLDDGRIGRGRDREVRDARSERGTEYGNVRPLRRDAAEARDPMPAAEFVEEVDARELASTPREPARGAAPARGPVAREAGAGSEPVQERLDGFDSPFEDEFDEPAFLRRKRREETDREQPAFLRRSAD